MAPAVMSVNEAEEVLRAAEPATGVIAIVAPAPPIAALPVIARRSVAATEPVPPRSKARVAPPPIAALPLTFSVLVKPSTMLKAALGLSVRPPVIVLLVELAVCLTPKVAPPATVTGVAARLPPAPSKSVLGQATVVGPV